jgi:hypothetical protein
MYSNIFDAFCQVKLSSEKEELAYIPQAEAWGLGGKIDKIYNSEW